MRTRVEVLESGAGVELRLRCSALGDGALRVLGAFVHYGPSRCSKCLHRDELKELTGLRGSSVVAAGSALVSRGLALWDDEIGSEALHLNDFGLALAIERAMRGGGA